MARKPSDRPVLPAVENLRTLFNRAHGELNLKPPEISARLHRDIQITWAPRELYRFISGETRNTMRPMAEIIRMSDYMKTLLGEPVHPTSLQIPLSAGQQTLVASGVLDMDEIARVIYREMERQVVALAKPATPKP